MIQSLAIITCASYIAATISCYRRLATPKQLGALTVAFALLAIAGHGYCLFRWIDTSLGQNLSLAHVMSQVAWLIALLLFVLHFFRPVAILQLFIWPLAVMSIVAVLLFPESHLINTAGDMRAFWHIWLALWAFSIMVLAACQALLLALLEKRLRGAQSLNAEFPPLETMERFLFQLIAFGFLLLTALLVSSLLFFHQDLTAHFINKLFLTVIMWGVFAGLLVGRYFFGWRGRVAIRWTLLGAGLLVVVMLLSTLGPNWLAR
jgi:ABC-type uncharacterized transport system permease subunit